MAWSLIMPLCNRMFCCIFGWYFYIELRLKCEKKIIVYPYGAAVIWLKNWNQRQQWKENYIQAYGAAVRILKILVKMIRIRIQKLFITKCETCSSQVECDQEIDEEWKEALILCILCNFLFPNCKWSGGWSLEIATSYFLSKPQIMFAFLHALT